MEKFSPVSSFSGYALNRKRLHRATDFGRLVQIVSLSDFVKTQHDFFSAWPLQARSAYCFCVEVGIRKWIPSKDEEENWASYD